ncbi:MAG: hopanoid biosynthesis-associated protein HpnK [Candidatus Binatia bacterium]
MTLPVHYKCYLIVNGDDFGLSCQVNAGILHAHQHGILTNTSLMVTGPAWRDAVTRAKDTPTLSVGLHLTLVQGRAVLPPHLIPALTDFAGNFPDSPTRAGLRYFFSPQARLQVRDECRAQIERFLATGLPLSHVDGHANIHMHPVVQDVLLALLPEYSITAMRLTQEDVSVSLAIDSREQLRKRWESLIFTQLAQRARKRLQTTKIVFPDRLFGLHQSGVVTEPYLLQILSRLQPGVTELYCHPAFLPCPEVQRWTPHYRRDVELAALTSPGVQAAVQERGICLLSYRSLPEVVVAEALR